MFPDFKSPTTKLTFTLRLDTFAREYHYDLLARFAFFEIHSRILPRVTFLGLHIPPIIMGNDGGSIPKRRELVKSAARNPTVSELKATALESLSHAWSHDPLNSERLDMENPVSDWRGRLYNYETILKALMPSDDEADKSPASSDSQEFSICLDRHQLFARYSEA